MKRDSIAGILAPRLMRRVRDWAEDRRGIAAVEFALIAAPFFFLIFGLLEVCVLFIMSSVLEHGINEAARDIRTGQAQQNKFSETQFKQSICDELFDMLNCDAKLTFDVKTFNNFSSTEAVTPIDEDTGELDDTDFDYDPGGASEIVIVRVFYEWDLVTPVLSAPLANMSDGRRLLQATVAFRNEPFGEFGS